MSIVNEKGDVFYKAGLTFPDENQFDFSLSGHPVIILLDAHNNDEHIYFLAASKNVDKYPRNPEQYFIIKNSKENGLRLPSIINLENIFKKENRFEKTCGRLSEEDYRALIEKFKKYQNVRNSTYYNEIKDKL